MEKNTNYNETGLWVIRDHDGLYLCTKKPFKNFYAEDEDAFTWNCNGDFMKINVSPDNEFSDMAYLDEPKKVKIISELK